MINAVNIERILHAPVSEVWKAITDKNEMKQWYFDLPDFKPEKGFTFQFNGGPEDGPVYVHLCEVTEVIPQKKLTYTWRYDGFPGISHLTWELEPKGKDTLLTLNHTGLDTIAPAGPDFAVRNFEEGWDHFVNKALPQYVEKKSEERVMG